MGLLDLRNNQESIIKVNEIPIGIGLNSLINGTVIDKKAWIGSNVIGNPFHPGTERYHNNWSLLEGNVVIPTNVIIPNGAEFFPSC